MTTLTLLRRSWCSEFRGGTSFSAEARGGKDDSVILKFFMDFVWLILDVVGTCIITWRELQMSVDHPISLVSNANLSHYVNFN
jgi:hypothetical protein